MMLKMDGENTLVSSAVNGEDIKVVRKFSADGLEIVSNIFTIYKYSLLNSKIVLAYTINGTKFAFK